LAHLKECVAHALCSDRWWRLAVRETLHEILRMSLHREIYRRVPRDDHR